MSIIKSSALLKTLSYKKAHYTLNLARKILQIEIEAILGLRNRITDSLNQPLLRAIDILLECKGHIIISGIGKSGHIGRKIAATLVSTGTPALFIHPVEAVHGDIGIVTSNDTLIIISNSGETIELMAIIPIIKRIGIKLIAMTGNNNSSLAKLATVHLDVSVAQEACTLNLVPTASTTATLAMGDTLAILLLDARGFTQEDFTRSHPSGALNHRIPRYVRDVMRTGKAVPMVNKDASLVVALTEMTSKGIAMTAIVDDQLKPIGIFTDNDLRQLIIKHSENYMTFSIYDVMHHNPHVIPSDQLTSKAIQLMETLHTNQIFVTNKYNRLIGIVYIHDLAHIY